MFVGLVDTRDQRPDRDPQEPLWLDLPELRPWRWWLAAIALFVAAGQLDGWLAPLAALLALACVFQALASYCRGNDGLSKYRQ